MDSTGGPRANHTAQSVHIGFSASPISGGLCYYCFSGRRTTQQPQERYYPTDTSISSVSLTPVPFSFLHTSLSFHLLLFSSTRIPKSQLSQVPFAPLKSSSQPSESFPHISIYISLIYLPLRNTSRRTLFWSCRTPIALLFLSRDPLGDEAP